MVKFFHFKIRASWQLHRHEDNQANGKLYSSRVVDIEHIFMVVLEYNKTRATSNVKHKSYMATVSDGNEHQYTYTWKIKYLNLIIDYSDNYIYR